MSNKDLNFYYSESKSHYSLLTFLSTEELVILTNNQSYYRNELKHEGNLTTIVKGKIICMMPENYNHYHRNFFTREDLCDERISFIREVDFNDYYLVELNVPKKCVSLLSNGMCEIEFIGLEMLKNVYSITFDDEFEVLWYEMILNLNSSGIPSICRRNNDSLANYVTNFISKFLDKLVPDLKRYSR